MEVVLAVLERVCAERSVAVVEHCQINAIFESWKGGARGPLAALGRPAPFRIQCRVDRYQPTLLLSVITPRRNYILKFVSSPLLQTRCGLCFTTSQVALCCRRRFSAILNPEKVVLAGPLAALGQAFFEPLNEHAKTISSALHQEAPIVTGSELGVFNGALGAAALALHEWKPKR